MGRFNTDVQAVMDYLAVNGQPDGFVSYDAIEQGANRSGVQLDDALEEMNDNGLIEPMDEGGNPFSLVKPRPRVWALVDESVLGYNVEADKLKVAQSLVQESPLSGPGLEEQTELPRKRINIAVLLLDDAREAKVDTGAGPAGYAFYQAEANYRTRQLLSPKS